MAVTHPDQGGRSSGARAVVQFALAFLGLLAWPGQMACAEPAKQAASPSPAPAANPNPSPTPPPLFPSRFCVSGAEAFTPREPQSDFEVQLSLVQRRISPGPLDGVMGPQTEAALLTFQAENGLPLSGQADPVTRQHLLLQSLPLARMIVTQEDLDRLRPLSKTWLGKSQEDRLEYETLLEMVAEGSQAHPKLIRQLNPGLDWNTIKAGSALVVPNAAYPPIEEKAAFLKIYLSRRLLQVYGDRTNLLAQFPCSIGRQAEKRPVGCLAVEVVIENPNYTFNPEIFPESAEGKQLGRKLVIPPGPNNPVGIAWIGLNRPGYGIHGTPEPEKVGRTESRGCFRLANWNAAYLARMAWISMPVFVEP